MSVTTYLRTCQQALKSLISIGRAEKDICFVFGNESADLDSCVSSIAYGYLASLKSEHTRLVVPVLNLAREDIKLRAELVLLLNEASVSEQDLICRDELPRDAGFSSQYSFALVDHNHFKVEGIDENKIEIEAVIDHHVDEQLYLDASPRIIRTCGSCTSLVVDYFRSLWEQDKMTDEAQLTQLALSAILVDTSRLSNQATETDFTVVKFLRSRLMGIQGWNEENRYRALQAAKRDITGLSVRQLLRRDYKEWSLGRDIGLWGISSITTSLEHLICMSDWEEDLRAHCQARRLDVHIIMTKHGEKELLLTTIDQARNKYVAKFLDVASKEMLLRPWSKNISHHLNILAYEQGELSATRKKVASILQQIKSSEHDGSSL